MIEMTQIARTAIFKIIEEEGGFVYTDHPVDRDKGTYAGIRYKTFKAYQEKRLNQHLLKLLIPKSFRDSAKSGVMNDLIIDIYYDMYYQKLNIDKLPDVLKMPVFSCGVNTGVRRAGIILQRTVNEILKYHQDTYDEQIQHYVEIDGFIGDITISTLNDVAYRAIHFKHHIASQLPIDGQLAVLVNFDKLRNTFIKNWLRRYFNVIHDVPELSTFANGWFNRATKYWVF